MAELTVSVDVDASVDEVWAAATDWSRQHEWIVLTDVRDLGDGRLEAFTGWRGVGFTDPMTVTTWEPPYRCVVAHHGTIVRGSAAFEVQPLGEGRARFVWTEWLTLPFGIVGELGFAIVRPLVMAPLRWSMNRFARWVSTRGTSGAPSPGTT